MGRRGSHRVDYFVCQHLDKTAVLCWLLPPIKFLCDSFTTFNTIFIVSVFMLQKWHMVQINEKTLLFYNEKVTDKIYAEPWCVLGNSRRTCFIDTFLLKYLPKKYLALFSSSAEMFLPTVNSYWILLKKITRCYRVRKRIFRQEHTYY